MAIPLLSIFLTKLLTEDLAASLCPAQKDCPLAAPLGRLPCLNARIRLLDGAPAPGDHGVHAPPLVASSIA